MQLLLRKENATARIVTALLPIRNVVENKTVSTESLGARMPPALCYFHEEVKADPLNTRNSATRTRTASVGPNKRGAPLLEPRQLLARKENTHLGLLASLTD